MKKFYKAELYTEDAVFSWTQLSPTQDFFDPAVVKDIVFLNGDTSICGLYYLVSKQLRIPVYRIHLFAVNIVDYSDASASSSSSASSSEEDNFEDTGHCYRLSDYLDPRKSDGNERLYERHIKYGIYAHVDPQIDEEKEILFKELVIDEDRALSNLRHKEDFNDFDWFSGCGIGRGERFIESYATEVSAEAFFDSCNTFKDRALKLLHSSGLREGHKLVFFRIFDPLFELPSDHKSAESKLFPVRYLCSKVLDLRDGNVLTIFLEIYRNLLVDLINKWSTQDDFQRLQSMWSEIDVWIALSPMRSREVKFGSKFSIKHGEIVYAEPKRSLSFDLPRWRNWSYNELHKRKISFHRIPYGPSSQILTDSIPDLTLLPNMTVENITEKISDIIRRPDLRMHLVLFASIRGAAFAERSLVRLSESDSRIGEVLQWDSTSYQSDDIIH